MAIEGPLKELGIQDVLQLLDLAHKTGVLTVRSERRRDEALVHFERGTLVFAVRRRSMRRLGQQLLRSGKLTERELERALELQRQDPMRRLGEILLEMGSVAESDLERQLRFQIEETVYDLMAWDEGYFRFEETPDVAGSDAAVRVEVRVESLLMEGARRIDEWTRLESRVPSLDSVPVLASGDVDEAAPLELRAEECEILAEIDGERDLRGISSDLSRSSFDVAKTVFGLVSMGVVTVQERAAAFPERELNAARDEVERLLENSDAEAALRRAEQLQAASPERADLALLTGRALAALGRMRAATEAFARAAALDPLSAETHLRLGHAAARVGELERAERAWDAFLRLSPEDVRRPAVEDALAAVRRLNEVLQQGAES